MVYPSSEEPHLLPWSNTPVLLGDSSWDWSQFHSIAAAHREPGELLSGTHLQHLGVIEDLVLVAALSDREDTLREIGAFV